MRSTSLTPWSIDSQKRQQRTIPRPIQMIKSELTDSDQNSIKLTSFRKNVSQPRTQQNNRGKRTRNIQVTPMQQHPTFFEQTFNTSVLLPKFKSQPRKQAQQKNLFFLIDGQSTSEFDQRTNFIFFPTQNQFTSKKANKAPIYLSPRYLLQQTYVHQGNAYGEPHISGEKKQLESSQRKSRQKALRAICKLAQTEPLGRQTQEKVQSMENVSPCWIPTKFRVKKISKLQLQFIDRTLSNRCSKSIFRFDQ